MSDRPILVTGATGFLGGRLVQALLDRGGSVRILCRPGSEALAPTGADVVLGDVTDAASFAAAARGAGAIVHLAARVARGGTRRDFDRVNVAGLGHALRAAAAHRVERVVYASSFFALGPSEDAGGGAGDRAGAGAGAGVGVDEDGMLRPIADMDHYQASKRAAALLARRWSESGAPLVTLYPGVLVGPGRMTEGNFMTAMLRDHLRGRVVPLPAGGRRAWSYVHVDDVVAAHLAALDRAPLGSAWVVGGQNATLRDVFDEVRALTGVDPPRLSAPPALLWSLGLAEEAAEALVGRAPKQLTRGVARVLARNWALDSSRALAGLDHHPRPLRAILASTIGWLESEGLVAPGTLKDDAGRVSRAPERPERG